MLQIHVFSLNDFLFKYNNFYKGVVSFEIMKTDYTVLVENRIGMALDDQGHVFHDEIYERVNTDAYLIAEKDEFKRSQLDYWDAAMKNLAYILRMCSPPRINKECDESNSLLNISIYLRQFPIHHLESPKSDSKLAKKLIS